MAQIFADADVKVNGVYVVVVETNVLADMTTCAETEAMGTVALEEVTQVSVDAEVVDCV
jgi:hypothetical protein